MHGEDGNVEKNTEYKLKKQWRNRDTSWKFPTTGVATLIFFSHDVVIREKIRYKDDFDEGC